MNNINSELIFISIMLYLMLKIISWYILGLTNVLWKLFVKYFTFPNFYIKLGQNKRPWKSNDISLIYPCIAFTPCLEPNHMWNWIQLIIYYNYYIWNEIVNYIIEINYTVWNTCRNELNYQSWLLCF